MWAFGRWRLMKKCTGSEVGGWRPEGKRIRRSEGEEKKLCKILESKLDYWL
jgi:hypothetical protein